MYNSVRKLPGVSARTTSSCSITPALSLRASASLMSARRALLSS
jgi:hypothetical protein